MISIIIPALDEAAAIAATLRCACGLEGCPEVIVVDGGSSDDTAAIAGGYARVLRGRRGRARQMNLGAAQAAGDVLLFLHADTLLPQGAVAAVETALGEPKVVGGRFHLALDTPGWRYRVIGWSITMRDRLFGGFTGDQAIFVRRSVFEALGGYRELALMEDLDFGRRLARAGRVTLLPLKVVTSARRWQRDGLVKTVALMWLLRLLFVLRFPPSRLKRLYGETR